MFGVHMNSQKVIPVYSVITQSAGKILFFLRRSLGTLDIWPAFGLVDFKNFPLQELGFCCNFVSFLYARLGQCIRHFINKFHCPLLINHLFIGHLSLSTFYCAVFMIYLFIKNVQLARFQCGFLSVFFYSALFIGPYSWGYFCYVLSIGPF